MNVRPYNPSDADALWDLKRAFEGELGAKDDEKKTRYENKLTDEYRERYLSWVTDCVERDPGCLIVAVDEDADGELVGYAFVLPEDFAFIWDAAVLNELYLKPDYRGTDMATTLATDAFDHARTQSLPLDRILLDVDPANERARAFYEKMGFEPWAEMIGYDL
jgi:ribosomal protein S18 acetylase RimI-like enzyme